MKKKILTEMNHTAALITLFAVNLYRHMAKIKCTIVSPRSSLEHDNSAFLMVLLNHASTLPRQQQRGKAHERTLKRKLYYYTQPSKKECSSWLQPSNNASTTVG